MSCYDLCVPHTGIACPQPLADSRNELCAQQCPDSTALIQLPPVVVTFPGPILSSFPQQSVVGSSGAPAFGGPVASVGYVTSGSPATSPYSAGAALGYGSRASALPALRGGYHIPSTACRYSQFLRGSCGPC
ncbi:scale keratin-like [Rhea pennata]|uniref:scale keratin-like n=1 Tax=Rhea pennata TaxID=8795 RepID=UPI002E2537C6